MIDISHWQGRIDWPTVAGTVRRAYIKSSEHVSWVDSRFSENWRNAKAAGIQRGAYHFFRANYSGVAQAQHFIRTIGTDRGELAPAVDVETGDGVAQALLTARLRACLLEVERLAVKPIIYSSASAWNSLTNRPTWAVEYEWWLAHYHPGITAPALPAHVTTWKYWQYTSTSRVPGIAGNVDLNRERVPPAPPPADTLAADVAARARAILELT